MTEERIHRAVSDDGTPIAGRLSGHGPALVLVHGGFADGDTGFAALLPWLREHYTCHAMSTRRRGLSGHSDDLSPDRLVEDVVAYVDSVGEPVRLFGVSAGGTKVLGAAARSAAVTAVAAWEPNVFEVIPDEVAARVAEVIGQAEALAAAGEPVAAVRTFLGFVCNDREMAALSAAGELELASRYLPVDLAEFEQAGTAGGLSPTDPSVLAKVAAPVLLLHGTESRLGDWLAAGVDFAASHLPEPSVRTVTGAGHLAVDVAPEVVARELLAFFGTATAAPGVGRNG